jgi:porin
VISGPLMNRTVTLGFSRRFHKIDLLGFGVNWGDPSASTLRDQYSTELFYRFQFSENLAFIPSVQWHVDPALNPTEDQIWVVDVRGADILLGTAAPGAWA